MRKTELTNRRARLAALLMLAGAGAGGIAHAQLENFERTPNAAIAGHNNLRLDNVTKQQCASACMTVREFSCKSFDYHKNDNACDLSDATAADVGGLKTDYADNPYDHYAMNDLVEILAQRPEDAVTKSPVVEDVEYAIRQMTGRKASIFEADLDGFVDKYGAGMHIGDHVQGITMTAGGRLVVSISRQEHDEAPRCGGVLAFSSPFDPDNPDRTLDWTYYCHSDDGLEGHPSAIQAAGDIVAVGTSWKDFGVRKSGSRYYHISPEGEVEHLWHLKTEGGRDATGLVYNRAEGRYYTLNADGLIKSGYVDAEICRTERNASLMSRSTKFDDCRTISVPASGQGSNLIAQADGKLFLASAFSSDVGHLENTDYPQWVREGDYGVRCVAEGAGAIAAGYDVRTKYEDVVVLAEIDFVRGKAKTVYEANIERTQRAQTCVQQRPAFRFAGGFSPYGKEGRILGLWSGRQNPVGQVHTDELEIAYQPLSQRGTQSLDYSVSIDCEVDDIGNESTGNTITATFYSSSRRKLGSASTDGVTAAACTFTWVDLEATLDESAEYVTISTNGDDGFMVDRIVLEKDGDEVRTYGLNNDKGWCFSTDRGDADGSWNYASDGVCVTEHTWSYSGQPVTFNQWDTLAAAASSNKPKVRYSLDIDCDVDGIDNEGTDDRITAVFMDANKKEIGRGSIKENTERGILGCYDIEFDVITDGPASWYRIETDGTDGAMLDQIFAYKNGEEVDVEGVSNDRAWCLSNDPDDASRSWKGHAAYNTCRASWEFEL